MEGYDGPSATQNTTSSTLSTWTLRAAAALCLAGYVFVYAGGRAGNPIRSDGFSYYVYLPSWFLFHDTTLSAVPRDCCGGVFPAYTAIIRWPDTRRWVNAHPIGVAIMQAPMFGVAHALTRWTNLSPDGFTLYYQHAVGLSGLLWIVAGLAVLGRVLRRHFSDGVTAATLLTILLGTNLYHYATFDSFYSHPYSFFLFAAFLDLTETWHAQPRQSTSVLLGLVAGLIVITRHTNVLFLSFFPLYGVWSVEACGARLAVIRREARLVAVIGIMAVLVVAPQLAIYYQATGHPFISSYGNLGFNFGSPRIAGVLFSVQKGLFFWSPLLLPACAGLFGLARSGHSARAFVLPAVLFLVANTYVIASWWDWQFGGSFGHRAFVDALPVFAIGLAAFFEWSARNPARWRAVTSVVVIAIALNLFQMLQYWNGVMPMSDTTWSQYRGVFLKWR
ncbi:MAG: hypothetical protein M3P13_01320 [Acidobacteriota bacterium]|nr:hypothetical protein [Acidobacteriota bacterium]